MKRMGLRRVLALSGMIGVAIVGLSACAADDLSGGGGASTPSTTTSAVDDAADKQAADEQEAALDPSTCLVGEWEADNSFFLASIQQFGDEVQSVTGSVVLNFDQGGTVSTQYNGWTVDALVEGMTSTILRTGTDHGTYEVEGNSITLQDTEVGSQISVTAAGQTMTVAPVPVSYASAGFTCDSSTAVITTPDGDMRMTRR